MPKCLPRERGVEYQIVVALGASEGFFQTQDLRVLRASQLDNQTGRAPAVGDVLVDNQLLTPAAFAERYEVIDPLAHIQALEDHVDHVEFAKVGPTTICILTLKDGINVVGNINPPVGGFLMDQEGEEMAYADALRHLALLESHRIARRYALQESDSDQEDLQPHS